MLLTIEKLVYGGDGLARLPADERGRGKTVFAPFVLEGEQVEADLVEEKPGFARARVAEIQQASAQRVEPDCPYFQRCGGCHYQHASYEHQLEIKAGILKENLRRIAKLELDTELKVHPSPPWNYRNRSRLQVQAEPDFAVGYFKFNSHELLPVEQCPIISPLINQVIAALWEWGRATSGRNAPSTAGKMPALQDLQEIEFFANADDTQLLIAVYCAQSISTDAAKQLANQLQQLVPEVAGVTAFESRGAGPSQQTFEPKRIATAGAGELIYKTEDACYRVSAGAFFQVNRAMTNELVNVVTKGRSGQIALDLYAGVGLFSTMLAREFAQVIAVESSQTSHSDLLYNSPKNVRAVHATSANYLEKVAGKVRADLVVVDPPRRGLGDDVIRGLLALGAPRIAYVSCDPATLARDLGRLLSGGYRVEQAHLVDLFPQTYHLESVFHLVR